MKTYMTRLDSLSSGTWFETMTGQKLKKVRLTASGTVLVEDANGNEDTMVSRALVEPVRSLTLAQRNLVRQMLSNIEGEYESGESYVYVDNLPMASKSLRKFRPVVESLIYLGLCYYDKAEGDDEVWLVVNPETLKQYV